MLAVDPTTIHSNAEIRETRTYEWENIISIFFLAPVCLIFFNPIVAVHSALARAFVLVVCFAGIETNEYVVWLGTLDNNSDAIWLDGQGGGHL